jgi:hypothetical protein
MDEREIIEIVDKAVAKYQGNTDVLASAIGVLMLGRHFGWRPVFLMFGRKTLRSYEDILDIKFKDVLPPVGVLAHKSIGWNIAKKLSGFWKMVKGEVPGVKSLEVE